jgi:hypothetical protein
MGTEQIVASWRFESDGKNCREYRGEEIRRGGVQVEHLEFSRRHGVCVLSKALRAAPATDLCGAGPES